MIKLRFLKLPYTPTELNQAAPLSAQELTLLLAPIGIKIDPGEDPAAIWVEQMHIDNNLPYIPGLIDVRILMEIEANPDVRKFVELIGLEVEDTDAES